MKRDDRLSVLYLVPGSYFDPAAGPTRNVLELAKALSRWARVTVAFRDGPEDEALDDVRVDRIDPGSWDGGVSGDDSAIRGIGYGEFLRYLASVRGYLREQLPVTDVVLEKSWILSGFGSAYARRSGTPGIPVENVVPVAGKVNRPGLLANLRSFVGQRIAGYYLRRAPLILAETEQLKKAMASEWGLPEDRIRVAGVGIDHERFRPRNQAVARERLDIGDDAFVLLYVGILDQAHDLGPLLEALAASEAIDTELHIVGDGPARSDCERRARAGPGGDRVYFHGTVEHRKVPEFIAAADLCVAPYDAAAFPEGEVGYSILKVREYLCAGRPVVSIPSGTLLELVQDGETGFLFPNDVEEWRKFLRSPPDREVLRNMGSRASKLVLPSWEDVGQAVFRVIESALVERPQENR